jgi:hypothetical protein
MDIAETHEARRRIVGHRRALGIEATAALIVLVGLVESLRYVEGAAGDLQIGFGLALFTFSVAILLLFHHAGEVLDLECPRCAEAFHGDGVERASSPFRRRCAHCELPASPRGGA